MERYLHARSGRCLVGLRDGRRAMTNGYQAGRSGDDALEFPDGTYVLLTDLREGQQATVFQLPAQPKRQPRRRPRRASSTLADIRWITRLIGIGGLTTPPFPYGGSMDLGGLARRRRTNRDGRRPPLHACRSSCA